MLKVVVDAYLTTELKIVDKEGVLDETVLSRGMTLKEL